MPLFKRMWMFWSFLKEKWKNYVCMKTYVKFHHSDYLHFFAYSDCCLPILHAKVNIIKLFSHFWHLETLSILSTSLRLFQRFFLQLKLFTNFVVIAVFWTLSQLVLAYFVFPSVPCPLAVAMVFHVGNNWTHSFLLRKLECFKHVLFWFPVRWYVLRTTQNGDFV